MLTLTNFRGMPRGKLFLVPSPLGNQDPLLEIPAAALNALLNTDYFIVEDIRNARRLIASLPGHKPIDKLHFQEMGKHSAIHHAIGFLQFAVDGHDIVLLSEAGSPCVADPGGSVVAAAHRMGLSIMPLAGPSSIIQALMASGLNGQKFCFHGYLPVDKSSRNDAIRNAEKNMLATGQTQILIETPFRNDQMLGSIIEQCAPSTMLCVAIGIATTSECIRTYPVSWWKANKPALGKIPAVFVFGKSLIYNQ